MNGGQGEGCKHSDHKYKLCPWPGGKTTSMDEAAQIVISEQMGKEDPTMGFQWWEVGGQEGASPPRPQVATALPREAALQVPGDTDGVTCSAQLSPSLAATETCISPNPAAAS